MALEGTQRELFLQLQILLQLEEDEAPHAQREQLFTLTQSGPSKKELAHIQYALQQKRVARHPPYDKPFVKSDKTQNRKKR